MIMSLISLIILDGMRLCLIPDKGGNYELNLNIKRNYA